MAIEDSAVLAKLFGHLISADQVTSFLYAFPELRQGRTKSTRVNEMGNIYFMAMPDDAGALQRDEHFKARRDKNLSPLEDESGDASSVWESIKDTWCYDAEDEADDWWVGWGMLRLRSQQTELNFGMELQVSTSIYPSRLPRPMHFPEYSAFVATDRPIMITIFFSNGSQLNRLST
jgi:salicylate hydroxylase